MATSPVLHTSYLADVLDISKFNKTVKQVCATIKRVAPDAEGIAFRGSSGSLIAMAVCAKLKKFPMLIRKEDGNHSSYQIEGVHCKSFVIVDDLVCSGSTVRKILGTIDETYKKIRARGYGDTQPTWECKGIICYSYIDRGTRPYHSSTDYEGDDYLIYASKPPETE